MFKDIVPLYATDLQETEKRLQNIITKEERFMLNQELMLVELYEKYNRLLFSLKQNLEELVQKEEESEKRKKLRQSLEKYDLVMCKALSELGKELYHYNYAREIVKYVLRFALHKKEDVRQIVTDFVSFFLSSQNPSTYTFKLLILEHFEKLFKQKKFVSMMPESVFAALTHTYTEDSSVQAKQDKSDDSLDKRIQDLRDRKRKNKLSKSGDKQLKQLEFQRSRRNERRKKQGLDDPRLQKELKNELAQSEAVIDPAKINKLVVYSDSEQPDHPEVLLHHVQGREGVPRQQALHDGGRRHPGPRAQDRG